ncbi:MAG: ATP-binding protein, partial [Planctomycetia bacterium]|nr:ATP-binding protein [Planctomycetia bacterium]
KIHIPGILAKCDEFDIRGAHVNYINVNGKPWGSVGFITQYAPAKKLTKNELRLMEMIAHVIELAIYRKQIYSKLEVAVKNAQAADRAKSFFLASMSHEIRTPLNAVIGFADLLKDNRLDPETQQEYLSNISLAGNALLQLVNDILDLSKLEAGQIVFFQEKTNISDFCREIVALFKHSANQKNLLLACNADNVPDLYIDQQRMRQILFNLVGNAIKFTNTGGIKVLVDFRKTTKDEGTLTLSVADTGVGVAPEDKIRLFEPFVQLTRMRGTNSANNGTGLGLPSVKKMINQMGGTITLESTVGKGSVFKIVIPKIKLEKPEISANTALSTEKKENTVTSDYSLLKREDPRVLLVDDTPLNLKVLSSMLKRLHVYFETASSGKVALELLKYGHFNIVLTDLIMTEMNGEELARTIRANPEYESMRIAAITAEHDKTTYDHTLFDRILEKPISRDVLYEYIFWGEKQ